jgi:hypothetical protein
MPTYRIMRRLTRQWWEGDADSPQEACDKAGWMIGNCWVRERTPVRSDPSTDSGYAGGGWRNITKKEVDNHEL